MLIAACSAAPGDEAATSTSEAIYTGVVDNDAKGNEAVVALRIGDGAQQFMLCTGSLIAPNVVLTARHCVSTNLTQGVSCDENGVSGNGTQLGADFSAATIHVFTGAAPNLLSGTPAANAKAIFHGGGSTLCNADMAVLVLDRNITGITPLKVRLASKTAAGESLRAVGYGQNDKGLNIGTRFRKDAMPVLAVGSKVSASGTPLGSNEFELGEAMCEGDSGGPVISESTGAIVGVVSRGGACTDTTGHIYTSLTGFSPVFQQAFALAGGQAIDETATVPPPGTTGGTGGGGGSGATNGGTSGGTGGGTQRVNLRSGAGKSCSVSGAPSPAATTAGGMAIGVAIAAVLLAARRRRRDD